MIDMKYLIMLEDIIDILLVEKDKGILFVNNKKCD